MIIVTIGTCKQCGNATETCLQEMQWDFPIYTQQAWEYLYLVVFKHLYLQILKQDVFGFKHFLQILPCA